MRLFPASGRRRPQRGARMRRDVCAAAVILVAVTLTPPAAAAQEPQPETPTAAFTLRTSIKASALLFRTPDAPELFPARTGAASMWRMRVEPEMNAGRHALFSLAYEQRLRHASSVSGLTTVGMPAYQGQAPFRIRPLDWSLAESSGASWRHEIDRASMRLHVRRVDLTLGRQAVGWGRGVMFGAVDLFAPFSPLEADREWRRGVDAVRADVKLTERSSVDLVGAFGTAWDRSAVAARLRGYAGPMDIELVGGRRARDLFSGVTTSVAVGGAELHGEVAAFRVPADASPTASGLVWKAVVGGSYRVPIGSGLLTYAEYHYSGFGSPSPEGILTLLSAPDFTKRYLRGDTQILSRHAVALTAFYEASTEVNWSGQWVHNPRDRSGVIAPGLTYTVSDEVSLLGTTYVPYGRPPRGVLLRSEYGAASLSGLLQLRVYL